jgi:undecaprenyl-diphosphatase
MTSMHQYTKARGRHNGSVPTPTVPQAQAPVRPLHAAPPFTPHDLYAHRMWFAVVALAIAFLAGAAAVSDAALLRVWDVPIQHFVERSRTSTLDEVFRAASLLGSTVFVLSIGGLSALLVAQRCRAAAVAILAATLGRPAMEWTIKVLVDRPRPDFEQMVNGAGPSFPSGHVLAAVATWGLLPMVVALYTHRRAVWWCSVVVSVGAITMIGASRVYLGVHWFSDVVAGVLVGSFFLLFVEHVLKAGHVLGVCDLTSTVHRPTPGDERVAAR